MRYFAAFLLFMTVAGCLNSGGGWDCRGDGTRGELDQVDFEYGCVAAADPYCDYERQGEVCEIYCESLPDNSSRIIPELLALGSRFQITCDSGTGAFSSAPTLLSDDGSGILTARFAGRVAVLAGIEGRVKDFYHLDIVEPAAVRVDRLDSWGGVDRGVVAVDLAGGDGAWLRAVPVDGEGRALSGALACTWSASPLDVALVTSEPTDNLVAITADGSGVAEVRVALGELEASVQVSVRDATEQSLGGNSAWGQAAGEAR